MSTTTQEQNHLPSEEHNHNQTNFVKNDKSETNETNPVEKDNHVPQKEHDEPKQNQQMPDQSGTSLTEKIHSNAHNEKLPEPHSNQLNSVIEKQPEETREEVIHQKEKEVTPKAHPKDQEEDDNLPVPHPEEKEATPKTHPEDKANEHVENDKKIEVSHQEEKEVTPKTHSKDKEKDQEIPVSHQQEKEETPETLSENKEKESVEKNDNLPVFHKEKEEVPKTPPKNEEKVEEAKKIPVPHQEEKAVTSKTHSKDKEKEKKISVSHQKEKEATPKILAENQEKDTTAPIPHQEEKEVTPKTHSKDKEKDKKISVSHQKEKEATPKSLPENKEKESIEKNKKLPVSQNPEIQHDTDHSEPVEKKTPKHENQQLEPEIVHKNENKPEGELQEKPISKENDNHNDKSLENQNPQDRTNEDREETPKQILEEKPSSNAPVEKTEEAQEELAKNIGSIVNFFSTTKDNLIQSSDQAVSKLEEIISKSRLGSIIQGHEYTPVITSEDIKQQEEIIPSSTRRRKSSQTEQTPKLRNDSIENPLKVVKSPKKTTLPNKTPLGADSKTMMLSPDKSLSKLQAPKQPEFKNRNEIEEQIRQHKIIEIIKQKKALEMKLGSLNEQLVELQKVELSSSPNRSKSKPKESREEFLERKKKAVEFAKKMNQEQKAIEVRGDQRREARQVLVNKEIEALQKLADKKYERKKIMDFIKGQTEVVQKAKYGLSSLEEKKLELKQKREFDKEIDHTNTRDPSEHEPPHKLTAKSSSKKIYKSPMLPQVLAHDADVKKVDSEKVAKRKALHDKQVEYARGVKDVFLPKVQSKFEARKLKMGVYKSQQVEAHILRSGKDGLYGYLDKMKNEMEGPKYKKKPMKHHQNDEDDFDRPPTDFADDGEQNVNVAYGKQLVYELQDNWNLADGTMSSRKKHLSPRNPEVNSKYTIKHKKEKDLMIDGDHLSDTEQSVHAKRAEPRYEDDEDY